MPTKPRSRRILCPYEFNPVHYCYFIHIPIFHVALLFGENFYLLSVAPTNFTEAISSAARLKHLERLGHLITISANEVVMAKNLAPNMEFWVAAARTQSNNWLWVAGPENGTTIKDTFWGLLEPNADILFDALYQHQGNWYASAKRAFKYAIIEFECPPRLSLDGYCARMH